VLADDPDGVSAGQGAVAMPRVMLPDPMKVICMGVSLVEGGR
jgi:hypothetical protein